jgi:hypothetical protein
MEDKFDSVELRTNQSTKKPSPVKERTGAASSARKQYDTDVQVANCEYLDAVEAFGKAAASISNFDAVKFPNTLRPPLETVLLTYLRKDLGLKEFDEALFSGIAAKVPYQSNSIRKLSLNKVLPLMLPSEDKISSSLQVIANEARLTFDSGKVIESKGKLSEALREAIFNHVRLQITRAIVDRALKFPNQNDKEEKGQLESVNLIEVKRNAFKEVINVYYVLMLFRLLSIGPLQSSNGKSPVGILAKNFLRTREKWIKESLENMELNLRIL